MARLDPDPWLRPISCSSVMSWLQWNTDVTTTAPDLVTPPVVIGSNVTSIGGSMTRYPVVAASMRDVTAMRYVEPTTASRSTCGSR